MEWFYWLLEKVFYVGFVGSSILLLIIILLQEGKGGGIGEAFGGMGGETFGVRASGISRFTGWVAVVFMLSAVLIPIAHRQVQRGREPVFKQEQTQESPIQNQDQGEKEE